MRILVTGVSGFIGSHLSRRLIQEGHEVVGLLRESDFATAGKSLAPILHHEGFSLLTADIRSFSRSVRVIKKTLPQAIFHLAAAGVNDPFLLLNSAIRNNIYGTTNLLRAGFEAIDNQQIKKVISARTSRERTAASVYAASKASAWSFSKMFATIYEWPIVGSMIFQAYGPGQHRDALIPSAIKAAINNENFPMTSGNQHKDWIYIDDVVSALCQVLESDVPIGKSVEIGTGVTESVVNVVDNIYTLAGGRGEPLPGLLPDRPGEEIVHKADTHAAEKIIGWRARIDLLDGLKRCLDYERERDSQIEVMDGA